jgi:hypothetical protein
VCVNRGIDRGVEGLERAGKMQGTKVPFPKGTNVPAGTKVSFPTGTFVPVKKTFLFLTLKNKFKMLTHFLAISSISCEFEPDRSKKKLLSLMG